MTDNFEYYDVESGQYSKKRYEGVTETYVQYFFKKRREIVLEMLHKILNGKKNLLLLDIACADGVMLPAVDTAFPGVFSKFVGTDISPGMVEVARKVFSHDKRFSFFVKKECPKESSDIAFGLGYLTALIFKEEMKFLFERLKPGGYYLCTFATPRSVYARLKLSDKPYLKDYRTYSEYRIMLDKYFEIIEEVPYGLFIPKLWSVPIIARILQPFFDRVFRCILPNLYHEKVYLLKRKS